MFMATSIIKRNSILHPQTTVQVKEFNKYDVTLIRTRWISGDPNVLSDLDAWHDCTEAHLKGRYFHQTLVISIYYTKPVCFITSPYFLKNGLSVMTPKLALLDESFAVKKRLLLMSPSKKV